ncbi:MAG: hypothetical protein WEF28_11790 [Acidimicrobiia bacterium]
MGPAPRIEPRGVSRWYVAVLAVMAGAIRIPMWASSTHITFDEGVFLASTDLATAGFTQYRDFFASQGPLFIPLLHLGDLLGFGDPRGARTIMVISGMAIAVATYFILTTFASKRSSFLIAVLVATSGTTLYAAGPVQSEGAALAFALAAFAVTLHREDRSGALIAGVLVGSAVAIKNLHVAPTVLMVAIVLAYRRDWLNLAYTSLVALTVALATALFYGVERVFDQYVMFHLTKDNSANLLDNLGHSLSFLVDFDLPLLVLAVASLILLWRAPERSKIPPEGVPSWLPVAWMVSSLIVIIGFTHIDPGFIRVVAFLIPPLALLIAHNLHMPVRILFGLVALSVVFQVATIEFTPEPDPANLAAIDRLEMLGEETMVVSDDPGLAWSARRLSHPATVDPSYARFQTGYLTPEMVERALTDPRTCAFTSTSERFDNSGIAPPGIYQPTDVPGVYLRDGC